MSTKRDLTRKQIAKDILNTVAHKAMTIQADGGETALIMAELFIKRVEADIKPRTITTPEELDALPVGSVVLHHGRAFQHYPAYPAPFDEYQQWKCGDGGFVRSTNDGSMILPALVIHEATR